jgi:V/A-type H+-transporting ATPase subunit I
MYGVPNHNEIDPTPLVAITYFMIFGIMFGDLGHGIILFVVAILMWKLKGMELGKVLIPCSITSMIWGLIFGSFFGFEHALDPVYKLLFNLNEKPIEVMSTTTTNYIIYMSTGIGVVLVALAIFINVYSSIKQGNLGRALFSHSGLFGMIFYISVICGLLLQVMMSIPVFSNAFFWIFFIVIPLLAMLFGEVLTKIVEHKPNIKPEGGWGEYIIQNFFELFEAILSYMTNTVSFLRIGAYVLVHSGMLLVVFTLSAMVPENSAVYWLIVVLGNVFVIGLEALLVGIQVLRLEFYEIFNRFYQGDGVPFKPVAVSKN